MILKKSVILLLALVFSMGLFAQNEALFNRATDVYNEGDYNKAIEYYKQILENGKHSPELYFNMGNAYYKLNKIGPSIYYYEKALLLKPNDPEILNNLSYAQNMRLDAIETMPKTLAERLYANFVSRLTFDGWAKMATLFSILFVMCYLAYYFFQQATKKRIAFISSISFLSLAIFALVFAYMQYQKFKANNPAIIFSKEVRVLSEPNKRSQEVFALHEGTKVNVLDSLDSWRKIKIADGQTGWLSNEDLKLLKNF